MEVGARASGMLALGQDCYIYQNDTNRQAGEGGQSPFLSAKFTRCSRSVGGGVAPTTYSKTTEWADYNKIVI